VRDDIDGRGEARFMLRICFTNDDLARTTLGEEPDVLWEIVLSLHQLQIEEGTPYYGAWRKTTRLQMPRAATRLLELTPPRGYSPDFLTPPHAGVDFDDALEQVLSTPRPRIQRELGLLAAGLPTSDWTRALASGRAGAIDGLELALRAYHRSSIEPYWPSIRRLVRADIRRHSNTRQRIGSHPGQLLDKLHPAVRWEPPVLKISGFPDRTLHLDGRGLRLQPSVFCWRTPTKLRDPLLPPVLVYPVRQSPGALRADAVIGRADALAALLGNTRATALEAVATGCTTSELAARCAVSLPAVSRHARTLREAGLITTTRIGKAVHHELTDLGQSVLQGGVVPDGREGGLAGNVVDRRPS
jgi:DNA-binding transcriptional ArsR family regulator